MSLKEKFNIPALSNLVARVRGISDYLFNTTDGLRNLQKISSGTMFLSALSTALAASYSHNIANDNPIATGVAFGLSFLGITTSTSAYVYAYEKETNIIISRIREVMNVIDKNKVHDTSVKVSNKHLGWFIAGIPLAMIGGLVAYGATESRLQDRVEQARIVQLPKVAANTGVAQKPLLPAPL